MYILIFQKNEYFYTDGKWQDAIALVMRLEQITFEQAIQRLIGNFSWIASIQKAAPIEPLSLPPLSGWQRRAEEIIQRAQEALWGQAGVQTVAWDTSDPQSGAIRSIRLSPLDWLRERGLKDETIQKYGLGYISRNIRDAAQYWGLSGRPVFLPQGITLPGTVGEVCWYLKVRRPRGKPKYLHVRGSRPALFMANELSAYRTIVFCEGEFDTLLMAQEAGGLAGIATFGSASQHLDVAAWGWYLLNARRFLIAYDMDGKSDPGAKDLMTLRHSLRANVPQLQPLDKDLTDFYKSGGDLHHWLTFWLTNQAGAV